MSRHRSRHSWMRTGQGTGQERGGACPRQALTGPEPATETPALGRTAPRWPATTPRRTWSGKPDTVTRQKGSRRLPLQGSGSGQPHSGPCPRVFPPGHAAFLPARLRRKPHKVPQLRRGSGVRKSVLLCQSERATPGHSQPRSPVTSVRLTKGWCGQQERRTSFQSG